jgi:hypothetical protein
LVQKALRPRSPPDEPAPEGRSSVFQPVRLLAGLAVLVVGPAGTSTVLAAGLVLSRSARTLQNAIGYPLYVLGGVFLPSDLRPQWLAGDTATHSAEG